MIDTQFEFREFSDFKFSIQLDSVITKSKVEMRLAVAVILIFLALSGVYGRRISEWPRPHPLCEKYEVFSDFAPHCEDYCNMPANLTCASGCLLKCV
jgi:hypothetical protein